MSPRKGGNLNDDPPVVVPDVSFGSSVYSGGEGSGSRSVSVGLVLSAAAPSGGLAVSYQVGGSAVAGSDYSSLSGSVTFVQGSSSAAIAVSVTDDAVDDDAETIVLTLVDGAAYDLGTPSSTTITIADDDDPPLPKPDQGNKEDTNLRRNPDTNQDPNPGTPGQRGDTQSSAYYTPASFEFPSVEVTIAQEAAQTILEGEAAEFTVSYEHPMRLTVRALLDVAGDASLGTDYQLDYRLSDAEAWVSLGSDPESLAIDLPTPGGEVRVRVVSLHLGTMGTDIPLAVTVSDRSFVKSLALEVEPNGEASITLRGSGSGGTESDSSDDQQSNPDSVSDDPPAPVQASDSGDDTDNEDTQSHGSESVGADQQAGAGTDQARHFLTYAVKPGDTLESIAQTAYGDATAWERIFEANRGRVQNDGYTFTSSDSIRYGWVLDIPATVLVAGARSASSAPYASYTVESGDSLGAVSLKAYGDAGYWSRIEAANMGRRQADGRRFTDADSIEVGWVLRIPLGG
ncbi:Calx-beta domain-containing protein [Candidatus Poriferisocius sp.]|uniref:LysM peptidoglycan-binding domain-containing protein n=1 Tax=Candidatus Poriferisocius sp. TaxID=3101276 RepID=UPI003B5B18A5